jgi:hypothetical protein
MRGNGYMLALSGGIPVCAEALLPFMWHAQTSMAPKSSAVRHRRWLTAHFLPVRPAAGRTGLQDAPPPAPAPARRLVSTSPDLSSGLMAGAERRLAPFVAVICRTCRGGTSAAEIALICSSGQSMLVSPPLAEDLILPLIGGGLMLVLYIYGMTTEPGVVTGVAVGIIVLVYVLGFVMVRTAKDSPFLEEMQRRRAAGLSGPDEELGRVPDVPRAADA